MSEEQRTSEELRCEGCERGVVAELGLSTPAQILCTECEEKVDWCHKHRSEKVWVDCWNCGGEGYSDHDCGEDCCCCLHPEDNVICDNCRGKGGYKLCATCAPGAFDDC